jgi:hypothetical protein
LGIRTGSWTGNAAVSAFGSSPSDAVGDGGLGTIGDCVLSSSILNQLLTVRSGWTVAVALALLVAIGVVKPVRPTGEFARRAWEKFPGLRPWLRPRVEVPLDTERRTVQLYARPSWQRRVASLGGGVLLSLLIGALVALVLAASAIWFLSSLTGRLQ